MDVDDMTWCVVSVVRKAGGRMGFTADEIRSAWRSIVRGREPPTVAEARALMVLAVEQGDLRWSAASAPNGEPRVFHPTNVYRA